MNFASDNAGGVHPRIMAALAAANDGHVPAYGGDRITRAAQDLLREVFDAPDAAVHFVPTGTAANALSLSLLAPGWGKVFCHQDAHIQTSETGAPEFFTGGAKLVPVAGAAGRITAEGLAEALFLQGRDAVHAGLDLKDIARGRRERRRQGAGRSAGRNHPGAGGQGEHAAQDSGSVVHGAPHSITYPTGPFQPVTEAAPGAGLPYLWVSWPKKMLWASLATWSPSAGVWRRPGAVGDASPTNCASSPSIPFGSIIVSPVYGYVSG